MRGLTLIEVLAAVALLAIVAMATLPWITDARRLGEWTEPGIDPASLGDLADRVLSKPSDYGVPALLEIGSNPFAAITPDGERFTVRRVDADWQEPAHAWLVFESGGLMTARAIRLPKEPGQ